MIRPALALVSAITLCACAPLRDAVDPPPEVVRARGGGVAGALAVYSNAVALASEIASRPASRCWSGEVPDNGPITIEATLTFRRKGGRGPASTVVEEHRWQRDENSNIASSTRLLFALPDTRETERRLETRRVGDAFYRAFDDRFVAADRVPEIARALNNEARAPVDSLLSLIDYDDGVWQAASAETGLCRGGGSLGLPAPTDANIAWGADGRSGYIRWDDVGGATLIATFHERISFVGPAVEVPSTLWNVDADPTVEALTSWRERGIAEGWLAPPRVFGDLPR